MDTLSGLAGIDIHELIRALEATGKLTVFFLALGTVTVVARKKVKQSRLVRGFLAVKQSLEQLGPFMEVSDRRFQDLSEKLFTLETNLGPNSGQFIYEAIIRMESDMAFVLKIITINDDRPMFKATPDGECEWVNQQYAELTGFQVSELLGRGWVSVISETDRVRVLDEWQRAVKDRRVFEMKFKVLKAKGAPVCVHAQALPVVLRGKVVSYFGRWDECDCNEHPGSN